MKFLKSTVITFITNIFIFTVSILTTIVTSRMLGPDGKGVLSVANNVITFLILILGFGLEASNVFYIGKNKKNVNSALGVNLAIALFSSVILVLMYFLNLKYNLKFLKGLDDKTLIVVFLTIPILNFKSTSISILLGLQEVIKYNKVNIIDKITTFILLIIFIFSLKTPYWVIVSNAISVIVMLIILMYILINKKSYRITFDNILFKDMIKYGIKNQIGNIIQLLNYRLDVFIINYFLPVAQVGIYTNAVALGETMWQVSGSVATVVYPMTTNSTDKLKMKDFINKTTRITFYIVLICSLVLVLLSKPIILILLGKDFLGSADALIYLIPGISVFSISKIIANYIAGVGMLEKNIIASTVSCIATVILDLILIPRIGIIGASIATSISYIVFTIIIISFYVKITDSKISDLLVLTREDIKDIRCKVHELYSKILKKLN